MKTSMKTTMKTTMKFFAAIAIMMGFTMGAMAQNTDTKTITANATVAAAVSIGGVGAGGANLDFSSVTPGAIKTIGFIDDVITTGTNTGDEKTGHFTITKSANTQVTLDLTGLKYLKKADNTTLNTTYTAQLSDAASHTKSIPAPVSEATSVTVSNSGSPAFFADTTFQLDLGGTVTPLTTQPSGAYTATISLTATYN